jgi:transcriptional regulator with XRE-family HTH domain
MRFAEKFSLLIHTHQLSSRRFAELWRPKRCRRVSRQKIAEWMRGEPPLPRLDQLLELARYFGVPLVYLADDEVESPNDADGLSPVERTAVQILRARGMGDVNEVIRRLTVPAEGFASAVEVLTPNGSGGGPGAKPAAPKRPVKRAGGRTR